MKIDPSAKQVSLPEIVGKGYGSFWNFKGRFRVVKGSRASKKSKTTALNIIVRMMQYPQANTLVVRKVFRTLKDSCFTELKWAINRLGVGAYWEVKESPLEMTYTPTGQKIYFRGLDDPMKVTSITVSVGYLCWCWIEEAYEITKEADFDMLNESIRGAIPSETGLFKQITLTLNPWNEKHWIKKRFFDIEPSPNVFAITTNYLCNEWLDKADLDEFERMKASNPRRYQVAGLGNWGVSEGLVYENFTYDEPFDYTEISKMRDVRSAFGLDFGFTNDPTALFCGLISVNQKTIWVFDELYERALTNPRIAKKIKNMGYAKERIVADCEDPKSIEELKSLGLRNVKSSYKAKDSVRHGVQHVNQYQIIIHPKCVNFIAEIENYVFKKDKFGEWTNEPEDNFNHLMDAMRYALEEYIFPKISVPRMAPDTHQSYWRR